MDNQVKRNIRKVIEEIDNAYNDFSEYNYMNADYADFAGMAISQFQDAMESPDLTREELQNLLRKGLIKHKARANDVDWTKFVASYMAKSSNENDNSSLV